MANLMLSVMGAFAEFERALIRERQREGIALAKQRGVYRGRKPSLSSADVVDARRRIKAGDKKAQIARDLGISREPFISICGCRNAYHAARYPQRPKWRLVTRPRV